MHEWLCSIHLINIIKWKVFILKEKYRLSIWITCTFITGLKSWTASVLIYSHHSTDHFNTCVRVPVTQIWTVTLFLNFWEDIGPFCGASFGHLMTSALSFKTRVDLPLVSFLYLSYLQVFTCLKTFWDLGLQLVLNWDYIFWPFHWLTTTENHYLVTNYTDLNVKDMTTTHVGLFPPDPMYISKNTLLRVSPNKHS